MLKCQATEREPLLYLMGFRTFSAYHRQFPKCLVVDNDYFPVWLQPNGRKFCWELTPVTGSQNQHVFSIEMFSDIYNKLLDDTIYHFWLRDTFQDNIIDFSSPLLESFDDIEKYMISFYTILFWEYVDAMLYFWSKNRVRAWPFALSLNKRLGWWGAVGT